MSKFTAVGLLALVTLIGCAGGEQYVSSEIKSQLKEGNTLMEQGRLQEAIATYVRITDAAPHYIDAYLNLGQAYEVNEEYENAVTAYDRTIELKKNSSLAWMRRGSAKHELGDYPEARASLEKAINLYGGEVPAEAYNTLGLTLIAMGKYRSAVEELLNAIAVAATL